MNGNQTHLYLYAEDTPEFDIKQYFALTYNFIHSQITRKHNVLVHCRAGISRSVTIVCYYLMKRYGITPEKALNLVREKRWGANPNPGFMKQLEIR